MKPVVKKVSGLALAGLALAGLASRRKPEWRPPWRKPPDAGVREPRRPMQPSGSGAAAETLPDI